MVSLLLTITFNSQFVRDRVKLSGYRKFWLEKEKAEKKFKFPSLRSISNSKQNKPRPPQKNNHFWLME
jgi:hypothetical protein